MEDKKYKYYLVDDCIVGTDKEMTGFREVSSELTEGNCRNCSHSIKDNPNYFCFYYRKYVWNENEVPNWCGKYKENKK